MSNYKTWNVQDLIYESIKIQAEINSRLKTIVDFENELETYNPKINDSHYAVCMREVIDVVRKGTE